MAQPINKFPFTKLSIEAIPFEPKGHRKTYYDSNPTDLTLIVGEQTKIFYLQSRVKGSGEFVKVNLGKFGKVSLSEAKDELAKVRTKLNAGINPNKEKKEKRIETEIQLTINKKIESSQKETLQWLFDEYIEEHIKKVKGGSQSSITDINDCKIYFSQRTITILKEVEITKGKRKEKTWTIDKDIELPNWLDRPYRSITKREILDRFKLFGVSLSKHSGGEIKPVVRTYQKAFKYLSAAYNWIIPRNNAFSDEAEVQDDFLENPVDIITVYKLWYKSKPRERYLDFYQSESYEWWKALNEYEFEGSLARDYILVSLFQGGRSIEVAPLKWTDINLKTKEITYPDTKNNNDYVMPITNFVYEILERRFKEKKPESIYVFDYDDSKHGYIVKSGRWHFEQLEKISGVKLSHHDFRRTLTNIAMNEEVNIQKITLDYILKHQVQGVDKHYFIKNKKQILSALQKIEDKVFSQMEYFANNKEEVEA